MLNMNDIAVIFLNGTSSAGKTSIALELQARLEEIYFVYSRDMFQKMFPEHIWTNSVLMRNIGPKMFRGFHDSIATFAEAGNHIIVDHILNRPEWIYECADALAGIKAILVGVKCPIEVAEKRERERHDREIGLVRSQFDIVHAHMLYDIEVDTSLHSPGECANMIISKMKDGEFNALETIRAGKKYSRRENHEVD